jgi:hypothetical protein
VRINVLTSLPLSLFLTLKITGVLDSISNYEYIVIGLRDRDELSCDELFLRRTVPRRIVYATNCPRDELSGDELSSHHFSRYLAYTSSLRVRLHNIVCAMKISSSVRKNTYNKYRIGRRPIAAMEGNESVYFQGPNLTFCLSAFYDRSIGHIRS